MRISFIDGSTKGLKEESITSKKIDPSLVEVNMADGAQFIFPTCNIKEMKIGGEISEKKE